MTKPEAAPKGAKKTPGRPSALVGGKRVNVYLDAESIEKATKFGNGNVSDGIRKALRAAE